MYSKFMVQMHRKLKNGGEKKNQQYVNTFKNSLFNVSRKITLSCLLMRSRAVNSVILVFHLKKLN